MIPTRNSHQSFTSRGRKAWAHKKDFFSFPGSSRRAPRRRKEVPGGDAWPTTQAALGSGASAAPCAVSPIARINGQAYMHISCLIWYVPGHKWPILQTIRNCNREWAHSNCIIFNWVPLLFANYGRKRTITWQPSSRLMTPSIILWPRNVPEMFTSQRFLF